MKKKTAVALTLMASTLAVGVPVWLAIKESQRQGLEAETARALLYARDVLARSDATADQIDQGIAILVASQKGEPCSDDSIDKMRQVDLTSSYIKAIGFVDQGVIVCSSLGRDSKGLLLGSPDLVLSNGVAVYKQLRLPFVPLQSFSALKRGDYVAIIHKDLPINATISGSDVSLAVFSLEYPTAMISSGFIGQDWVKRLGTSNEITFFDGQHVVAVVKSKRHLNAAVAAVPINYLNSRTREAAQRLVPVGVFAGIALAASVLLLARAQMSIPSAIKAGLKRHEFFLLYQPIVDLHTHRWVGAEALIRWRTREGILVDPNFFIPVAEQSDLIEHITKRVFELVARDTGEFLKQHPDFHVAVNLSAADLHSPHLPRRLAELLLKTGAAPGNVIVEMTERGFLDVDVAREVMREVRARGISIAIDDFGTGYSSLSYLETLEVDYLKIDKSFIDAFATGAPTSYVVQHIIEMAKSLKLKLIAEGVETQAQEKFLRLLAVEYAQGWFFGKPMKFADIEQQISNCA
jgi:sensor c-di-GMP phosphodiesterase-like protein